MAGEPRVCNHWILDNHSIVVARRSHEWTLCAAAHQKENEQEGYRNTESPKQ